MMRYVDPRPKLHAWRHMGRTIFECEQRLLMFVVGVCAVLG